MTVRNGTSYTLALAADNHYLVECTNDAAVTLPLGARIKIVQAGAGHITVGGVRITLRVPTGKQAKTRLQHSVIVLTKRSVDEWILSGDFA